MSGASPIMVVKAILYAEIVSASFWLFSSSFATPSDFSAKSCACPWICCSSCDYESERFEQNIDLLMKQDSLSFETAGKVDCNIFSFGKSTLFYGTLAEISTKIPQSFLSNFLLKNRFLELKTSMF